MCLFSSPAYRAALCTDEGLQGGSDRGESLAYLFIALTSVIICEYMGLLNDFVVVRLL